GANGMTNGEDPLPRAKHHWHTHRGLRASLCQPTEGSPAEPGCICRIGWIGERRTARSDSWRTTCLPPAPSPGDVHEEQADGFVDHAAVGGECLSAGGRWFRRPRRA